MENRDANKKSKQRTYLKVKAYFQCSNDKCGNVWTSAHGWEGDEKVFCEFCDGRAEVKKIVDEMCEVAFYNCKCGAYWKSIHSGNDEICWDCGESVSQSGVQELFGRHFWFTCSNNSCKVEWEDFSSEKQPTQRCAGRYGKYCGSRGVIKKIVKIRKGDKQEVDNNKAGGWFGGGGGHIWENCDMCCNLKDQGYSKCSRYRKIQCEPQKSETDDDGRFVAKITAAST